MPKLPLEFFPEAPTVSAAVVATAVKDLETERMRLLLQDLGALAFNYDTFKRAFWKTWK